MSQYLPALLCSDDCHVGLQQSSMGRKLRQSISLGDGRDPTVDIFPLALVHTDRTVSVLEHRTHPHNLRTQQSTLTFL